MKTASSLTSAGVFLLWGALIICGCSIEKDQADARAAAVQVHANLRSGDFAAIYRQSAPRFKSVGSESEFVSRMNLFQQEHGSLKSAVELAYESGVDSRAGRTHTLVSNLEYEHGRMREHLILTRSVTGEMQLWKLDIQPAP
jgi:hypothetical protein